MQNGMRGGLIARASLIFVTAALFFGVYTVPIAAHADTATCNTPAIGNLVPHIYEGHLDSFDYYIDDTSGTAYLPISTTVAGVPVDLNYVSVWHGFGPGREMVHVDVPDEISLPADTVINVAILQITQGPPPICGSSATFHVKLAGSYTPPVSSTAPARNTVPTKQGSTGGTPSQPVTVGPSSSTSTPVLSTTTAAAGECSIIPTGWLIALAILDLLITALLLLFMSVIAINNWRLTVAVLLPPVVFLAAWYLFDTCHTGIWFPIISVILAIIVLTASGSPDYFEGYRIRIVKLFKKQGNAQLKLSQASPEQK